MLKRVLIWLRWPSVAFAALLLAAFVASAWTSFSLTFPIGAGGNGPWLGCQIGGGCIELFKQHSDSRYRGPDTIELSVSDPWLWWSWWRFETEKPLYGYSVLAPLWIVALAPASLALIGFRARYGQPRPGQCAVCRHTLAGSSICPECGRTPPSN